MLTKARQLAKTVAKMSTNKPLPIPEFNELKAAILATSSTMD